MTPDESQIDLSREHQDLLLDVARRSIAHGLQQGAGLSLDIDEYPARMQTVRATFVTLRIATELRGCMGSLHARLALVADVAENAYSAAFRDPRFSAVQSAELSQLDVSIAILNEAHPIRFDSELDLREPIRPRIDGLILRCGSQRGLLLPSVWETLPETSEFLAHLKMKAGLTRDFWSEEITVERFTATVVK